MVAVSVLMFTSWSFLFYHTCHFLLWYLVVVGIVLIFVVVIVSFHFILWCIVVVGIIFVELGISFHFLVWCMKVSRESSRAYMKLVWWIGDWVPGEKI